MNKLRRRNITQHLQNMADEIWLAMLRGDKIVIHSSLRFGKTWLQKELERREREFIKDYPKFAKVIGMKNDRSKNIQEDNVHNGNGSVRSER